MIEVDGKGCKVAVFVCTNERPPEKTCCKKAGGMDFYLGLKQKVKDDGLYNSHWICRSGCLGFCNSVGTTVAIFKDGQNPIWLSEVTFDQLDNIWEQIKS